VVEDNLISRQVVCDLLADLGCAADWAGDGAEAVRMVRDTGVPYDLVLMDCRLPVLDGYEASRRIRLAETGSGRGRVPIVALTANAMAWDRQACLDAGMDDYLAKPVTRAALMRALELRALAPGLRPPAPPPAPRPGPAPDERPVLDSAALATRTAGRSDRLRSLLAVFERTLPEHLRDLAEAAVAGDRPGVARHAHRIYGAASAVGGERLGARALAVEELAARGAAWPAEGIRVLEADFRDLVEAIRAAAQAPPPAS
jgi:CheY-like chemotaxis protein